MEQYQTLLEFLIRPKSIEWRVSGDDKPPSATHLVGEMELLVPLSDLIDKEAEISRLDKEIERKEKEKTRAQEKLGNTNFIDKAPNEVVQKERNKLAEIDSALEKLKRQKIEISSL